MLFYFQCFSSTKPVTGQLIKREMMKNEGYLDSWTAWSRSLRSSSRPWHLERGTSRFRKKRNKWQPTHYDLEVFSSKNEPENRTWRRPYLSTCIPPHHEACAAAFEAHDTFWNTVVAVMPIVRLAWAMPTRVDSGRKNITGVQRVQDDSERPWPFLGSATLLKR